MALTKVSRGLLSTGIVDNSNATAITLNADESATFAGAIAVTGTATASEMTVADTDDIRLRFLNGTTFKAGLQVVTSTGDMIAGSAVDDLAIRAQTNMLFATGGNTERMRLSGGNLLVGTTSNSVYNDASGTGIALNAGQIQIAGTGTPLYANRQGSDGDIIDFRKDGSTVGRIGVDYGTEFYMGGGGGGFYINSAKIRPTTGGDAGTLVDNTLDFGSSAHRFKDLYLSGGVYLGGTGAANKLSDVETGNWTPTVSVGTATLYLNQWYVKVGSLVTCYFYIYNLTQSTGTASVVINGLPFPKAVNHESYFSVSYGGTPSLPSNVTGVFGRVGQNGTNSIGLEIHRNAATSTVMTYAQSSGSHFAATFSYRTSA